MSAGEDVRAAGIQKLIEAYGDDRGYGTFDPATTSPESLPYIQETVDHLFGEIWNREALSVRDRRLLTMGVTAGLGRADVATTQIFGALKNEELTLEQLGEVVLHLAYYAGWPCGQAMRKAAADAVAMLRAEQAGESAS
jgi:4-carboxymuconolactone decarboxylase